MSTEQILFIVLMWLLLIAALVVILRWLWIAQTTTERLQMAADVPQEDVPSTLRDDQRSWLGWWLLRAGFRAPRAPALFLLATGISLLAGGAFALLIYQSGAMQIGERLLRSLPGGVGEIFLPIVWLSPLLSTALLVALPAVLVRARRRQRMQQIEQDLPLTLDLLATLAEAGLSFDAALDRVLETQHRQRPLEEEFRLFQLDILAGRPRLQALRRLRKYVDVPWFSIFVSALIHAEQVGASLAQTLRAQADDLRSRRRERALALAMAVPVKLLFPLIVCFLPGIMVAALGPIIYQIVQVLDDFLRGAGGA